MKETAGFKRRVEKLQDENHREEDSLRNLNFPVIFVFTADTYNVIFVFTADTYNARCKEQGGNFRRKSWKGNCRIRNLKNET